LKSTLYDGLCVFLKKNRGDPDSVKQSNFLRKKMLYQNMKMRHRLAPNFASSFS